MSNIFISESELAPYLQGDSLADKAKALLRQQKESWEFLRKGYESLSTVRVREFRFDNFSIKVQFNPGRIKSSAAKVDEASIKARKCFLCMQNLPEGQRGLLFNQHYVILGNPYPIFNEHFTVPHLEHKPQRFYSGARDILILAKELSKYYAVFYNGPRAGASAPDHLHFQAGEKDFMPLLREYEKLKGEKILSLGNKGNVEIFRSVNYLRNFLCFESNSAEELERLILDSVESLKPFTDSEQEPMMNILVVYEDKWKVFLFPRSKHRPDYYFREDESKILLSPATVDLGGVCITPREEDFRKITREIIEDIFRQVSFSDGIFDSFLERFLSEVK